MSNDARHFEYPDIAGSFAEMCKGDIDHLVSPYFEPAWAVFSGLTNAAASEDDRARAEAVRQQAVESIAATVGTLYEEMHQLCDPAAFFAMLAKAAKYHRPRGRPRNAIDPAMVAAFEQRPENETRGGFSTRYANANLPGQTGGPERVRKRVEKYLAERQAWK